MKKVILLILLTCSIYLSAAQLDDIYQQVTARYSAIKTFEAVLNQENYWSEIDRTKAASGKIYYNSDSLFISYLPPDEQELFVHGNTVIMHDKKSGQAIYMDKGEFFIRPVEIIKAYWQDSEKQLISSHDNETQLLLNKDNEEILIGLNNGLIISVLIKDENNNSVKYLFSQEKINAELPDNIFIPAFPYETNIIDNRLNGE
jgi:outer membrane lipoprotein-sorting protein